MKLVIDDKILFVRGVLDSLADVTYLPGASIGAGDVKDADGLIVRTRTKVNHELLQGSNVKAVVSATIGTDHMDIPWLEKNGIAWANAPGCNSGSVKQYIASVFAALEMNYYPLRGKTLGIIGVGNVGSKVADVGKAFGMKVLLNDPPRKEKDPDFPNVDLNVLLQMSDVVTFHVPLTREGKYPTYHMLNDTTLLMMKRGSVLINSSRGEVVNERILMKGLSSGLIDRGVLDVWENEPDISLELQRRLMIGTPHIAGYAVDGKANGSAAAIRFISRQFHLGLDEWYPENLPVPGDMSVSIDDGDERLNLRIARAVVATYDVAEDSRRLTENPQKFEELRGNYPVRREFPVWTVHIPAGDSELKHALELLGFKVVERE
ncbi:4-phosphoerythronate dehydrogenase [Anaerophaga thermohalophila]|uniref:4-phosphoerythronate dehydrogenase n=1 Tax=Anaerophaga thermohalophila TaxID=177400 RepID=UPI0003169DB1|nr:4-phosphoerythronate dehydrogenase [Anaerophaga thermohalophila]